MGSHDSGSRQLDGGRLVGRKPRADGVESRRTILLAAANLATTRGLEGLSIGELAQHIGMSKSGLYAHFKSKEELELATIETAAEIFERDVLGPASESPGGLQSGAGAQRGVPSDTWKGGCFRAAASSRPSRCSSRRVPGVPATG